MFIRKNKDGTIAYREKYYVNGKAIVHSFRRKSDAVTWKARMIGERQKQIATGVTYSPRLKFKEFAECWYEEKVKIRNKRRTQESYRHYLDHYLYPIFAKTPLLNISHHQVNALIARLRDKGLSNKTINGVVDSLKTILNVAVRWDYIPRSPLFGFQSLKINPKAFMYWSKTEIFQFLRANITNPLYPLFVVAVNTGMRKGELLGLCWDRINLVQNQIEITRSLNRYGLQESTKTYEKRVIPINYEVKQVLTTLLKKQQSLKYVFATENGEPLSYNHIGIDFVKAQKLSGIASIIRFHDLRHTFASQFVMGGGSVYTLQKLLGHTTVEMTMRYAHLANDYLQEAVNIVRFSGSDATSETGSKYVSVENISTAVVPRKVGVA